MTSTARNFTETRITEGIILDGVPTLGYIGQGLVRGRNVRFAQYNTPDARALHLYARPTDGVLTGTVKVTRLKNTVGEFYSLRSIRGNGRTVYLRSDARIIVEGQTRVLGELYRLLKR